MGASTHTHAPFSCICMHTHPCAHIHTAGSMYKWSFWCFQQLQGYAFVCIISLIPKDRVCGFMNSNFLWWYTKQRLWESLLHFIWNALKSAVFCLEVTSASPHQRIEGYIFWSTLCVFWKLGCWLEKSTNKIGLGIRITRVIEVYIQQYYSTI